MTMSVLRRAATGAADACDQPTRASALADRLEHGARALASLREATSPTPSGTPRPERRPHDRRRRASRRDHLPAGDPAGADARRRQSGDGVTWDAVTR